MKDNAIKILEENTGAFHSASVVSKDFLIRAQEAFPRKILKNWTTLNLRTPAYQKIPLMG